jgi:hypothetical protein
MKKNNFNKNTLTEQNIVEKMKIVYLKIDLIPTKGETIKIHFLGIEHSYPILLLFNLIKFDIIFNQDLNIHLFKSYLKFIYSYFKFQNQARISLIKYYLGYSLDSFTLVDSFLNVMLSSFDIVELTVNSNKQFIFYDCYIFLVNNFNMIIKKKNFNLLKSEKDLHFLKILYKLEHD